MRPFGVSAAAALETLAKKMADSEELWVPKARLETSVLDEIPKLRAAGVVRLGPDNLRIGFEHQTLFEFIRARSFVSGKQTFVEEALARQDGLAVRVVLWGAVNYLRNADWNRYCTETRALITHPDVRLHVKVLVVEYLGTVVDPQREEAGWLCQLLASDTFRPHVMRATERKPAWWALMKHAVLECGASSPLAAWHASWVIGPALAYDKTFILPSVEAQWLPRMDLDFAIFNLFRDFDDWSRRSCAIIEKLLGRTPFEEMSVCKIAQSISKHHPEAAVRVLRAKLDANLQKARSECSAPPEALSADASTEAQIARLLSDRSLDPIEKLVRGHNDWYGIDVVAKAAPCQFIEGLWDWVEAVSLNLTSRDDVRSDRYQDEYKWGFGGTFMSYLSQALWTAVALFATNDPDAFIEWAKRSARSEAASIHRLIMKGFEVIVSSRPSVVLEYFVTDQRRLAISSFNTQENVADLIQNLGGALSPVDATTLACAIERWEPIRLADAADEDRQEILRLNNLARLRLLRGLPRTLLRTETQDELSAQIQREAIPFSPSAGQVGSVKSSVTVAEMEKMGDSELLAVLDEYSDSRGMDSAGNAGRVGQNAVQFEELAKKEPARIFRTLPLLQPGCHELATAAALSGLSQIKDAPPLQTLDSIHSAVNRGFNSSNFRERLCWSIVKIAEKTKGLPDRTLDLLIEIARDSALAAPAEAANEQEGSKTLLPPFPTLATEKPEKKRPESILWLRVGGVLPHGSYPALVGMMLGLLRREPPNYGGWLSRLLEHLTLPDAPAVWQALLNHLRYLGGADATNANKFIGELVQKYPSILPTIEGARFVASSHLWFTQSLFDILLTAIDRSDWEQAQRAVGEILLLRAALSPDDTTAQKRLASARDNLASAVGELELGILSSASNTWANPRFRATSHRVIMAAVSNLNAEVSEVIMDAFSGTEGHRIPADSRTTELLRAIASAPAGYVSSSRVRPFIARLKELLQDSFSPLEIARAVRAVLDVFGNDIGNIQSAAYTSSDELMDIAITLQRFPETRAGGTWIFERLIAANAYKIEEAVRSLDRRLP